MLPFEIVVVQFRFSNCPRSLFVCRACGLAQVEGDQAVKRDTVAGRNAPAPTSGLDFPERRNQWCDASPNPLPATGMLTIAHFSTVAYFDSASGPIRPVPNLTARRGSVGGYRQSAG
jgi:hypothetical protein